MQKSLGISLHASCLLALGPGHNHARPPQLPQIPPITVHVTHSRGRHVAPHGGCSCTDDTCNSPRFSIQTLDDVL